MTENSGYTRSFTVYFVSLSIMMCLYENSLVIYTITNDLYLKYRSL